MGVGLGSFHYLHLCFTLQCQQALYDEGLSYIMYINEASRIYDKAPSRLCPVHSVFTGVNFVWFMGTEVCVWVCVCVNIACVVACCLRLELKDIQEDLCKYIATL